MSHVTITLSPHETVGRIAPEHYGHFAEHLGHCVHGGLWVGEYSHIPKEGGAVPTALHKSITTTSFC